MEGGNFFLLKCDENVILLTGIGVRGSNLATFKILADLLPEDLRLIGIPLAGYIRNWESGAVHLDVVFAYLGDIDGQNVALVDPSRMGFYSALEYDRKSNSFILTEFSKIAKDLNILMVEPPRDGGSSITMTNALNLGRGRFLVDEVNHDVNKYMEQNLNAQLIEVKIPQIEAGGGGPRCATRELYF
jgi:arginine deiminase